MELAMNNDWFYDILRFCNEVYSLEDIDIKYLKGYCEDIIEGENSYSSKDPKNRRVEILILKIKL